MQLKTIVLLTIFSMSGSAAIAQDKIANDPKREALPPKDDGKQALANTGNDSLSPVALHETRHRLRSGRYYHVRRHPIRETAERHHHARLRRHGQ